MRIAASTASLPTAFSNFAREAGLVLEVGLHAAADRRPVVHVEEQRADAVAEERDGAQLLVREHPAGELGGRHRVVGAGEDDLVEPAVAQGAVAVAGVREGGRRGQRARGCA